MAQIKEPQGVGFFNIKSGDTHYCKLEPTIAAYINSSDLGINATRGQDKGWRLAPEWVKKVRQFKADDRKMEELSKGYGGNTPSTTQILRAIYSEELRSYEVAKQEGDAPYEEQYLQDISVTKDTKTAQK